MIATHSIKYNGVWYKAGDEIKETAEVDNTSSAFSKSYTKTEINRMSTASRDLIKRKRLAEQI